MGAAVSYLSIVLIQQERKRYSCPHPPYAGRGRRIKFAGENQIFSAVSLRGYKKRTEEDSYVCYNGTMEVLEAGMDPRFFLSRIGS